MGNFLSSLGELDLALRGGLTGEDSAGSDRGFSARRLALLACGLGMAYGVCMGLFGVWRHAPDAGVQLVAAAVKVPLLFLLTLAVTYPSLYVFSALAGSRLGARGTLRLLVLAVAIDLAVLASLGPVVGFFAACTRSYPFIKLLNVLFFGLSGVISLGLLRRAVGAVVATGARRVFAIWLVVYGTVGAQMSWVLRPFIGSPHLPFEWLRGRRSSFFHDVLTTLGDLLQ